MTLFEEANCAMHVGARYVLSNISYKCLCFYVYGFYINIFKRTIILQYFDIPRIRYFDAQNICLTFPAMHPVATMSMI